jgi:aspartate dehydrogenase
MKQPARIVLLGFGAINQRVEQLLRSRQVDVEIVGVIVRRQSALVPAGVARIASADQLVAVKADVVLEAATREAVAEWGEAALRAASKLVVSSASAFADDSLLHRLRSIAREQGSQLVLSSGAIAGVDALSAAARAGLQEVRHRIVKHPDRWGQAAANAGAFSSQAGPVVLFRGSAREAATRYPLNANVTIVTALSGIGLDATVVELVADPAVTRNRHEIHATGDFGTLQITVENRPLAQNPKSSELAALALVRAAENHYADLVI